MQNTGRRRFFTCDSDVGSGGETFSRFHVVVGVLACMASNLSSSCRYLHINIFKYIYIYIFILLHIAYYILHIRY